MGLKRFGLSGGLPAKTNERAIRHTVPYKEHFIVMVSEDPFPLKSFEHPTKDSGTVILVYSDWPDGQKFATPLVKGRYLRIQVTGNAMLSLDRVRVWEHATK